MILNEERPEASLGPGREGGVGDKLPYAELGLHPGGGVGRRAGAKRPRT